MLYPCALLSLVYNVDMDNTGSPTMNEPPRYSHFEEVKASTFEPTGRVLEIPADLRSMIRIWQAVFACLVECGLKPRMAPFGGLITTGKTCWRAVRVKPATTDGLGVSDRS